MSRPRASWRRRLGLPLAALIVATLIVELGLRLYAQATDQKRGMVFDTALGWRMLPNLRKVGRQWSAAEPAFTNSDGWRDADFAREV